MSFNSSRTLQFMLESDRGLQALNRLEQGRLVLRGVVGAPGFAVRAMEPESQEVQARNVWTYVVMPERPGKQRFDFEVRAELADGGGDAQTKLFKMWADIISKADSDAQNKLLASDPEHGDIDVVQPLWSLEAIAQFLGALAALVACIVGVRELFKGAKGGDAAK